MTGKTAHDTVAAPRTGGRSAPAATLPPDDAVISRPTDSRPDGALADRAAPPQPSSAAPSHVPSADWLAGVAALKPHKVAVRDGVTGHEWTFGQWNDEASRWAGWLAETQGLRAGDRVAVLARNHVETVRLFFAVTKLGGILVPLNHRLTPHELGPLLADVEPRVLLHDAEHSAVAAQAAGPAVARLDVHEAWAAAAAHAPVAGVAGAAFEDAAMILFTSGTSGAPKGAVISHRMMFWNSVTTGLRLNLTEHEQVLNFLPFFHTGAWNVLSLPTLHRGGTVTYLPAFDAERVLALVGARGVTLLFGVPTTMAMLAQSPSFAGTDMSATRYAIVGGEAMPLPLIRRWHGKGVLVRQGFGLTEFGPNLFSLDEADAMRKPGSIGFPNLYVETRLVDEHGRDAGIDEPGELWLRGPQGFSGYWRREDATRQAFADGWLKTGDLLRRDAEGHFFVVGRKKDMFISGGENVYPAEVEQAVASYPGVAECAVLGVPDARWGEVGQAFVVAAPGASVAEAELVAHCRARLAKFKVPRHWRFVDALPKGDSGKVLKHRLRS